MTPWFHMSKSNISIVNQRTGKERPVSHRRVLSPLGEDRFDGWSNLVTGLGTGADKRMQGSVQWTNQTMEFYEQLYSGDELASRIVDIVPDDAMRKWIEPAGYSKGVLKEVTKRLTALDARGSCERAWKWGRAFGGALQYIVTDCVDPAQPYEPKNEKVLSLREMSRYDLRILTTDIETDFGSPNYGQPNIYYLNVQVGTNVKLYPIHYTRLIRYDGKMVPRRTYIRNNYWHDSVLQRLFNVIRNYQTSNDAAAGMLQDFSVGVIKMKDLANFMSSGKENIVKRRVEMMNYSKSTINALLLDSDTEEFTDLSRNVTGLPEMLDHMARRFVAATDIPHTKLLGESPDGSNATGNSTTQLWYQTVEAEQNNYLRPRLNQLMAAVFYDMPELTYKFNKLHQLTETEEGDLRNKNANTDSLYINDGVLDPTEVAKSRFGGDEYGNEITLDMEARKAGVIGGISKPLELGDEDGTDPGESEDASKAGESGNGKRDTEAGEGEEIESEEEAIHEEYNPWEDEGEEEEEEKLPSSMQEKEPNPLGVEVPRENQFNPRNNQMPGRSDKQESFITQTESLPFRDPRTDPKLPPPGRKPVRIPDYQGKYSAAGGSQQRIGTGPSLNQRRDAGESSLMPRQLDATKQRGKDRVNGASIVVRYGNFVLLGKRRDTGKWALPGGKCEPGETAKLTARRELWEETGLRSTRLLQMKAHSTDTGTVTTFQCFIAGSRIQDMPAVDPTQDPDKEFTELHWVEISEGLPAEIAGNLHHEPNLALLDVGLGKSST